jgi:hypothetical protein
MSGNCSVQPAHRSDLIQFCDFMLQNGHLLTQLARYAPAQPW